MPTDSTSLASASPQCAVCGAPLRRRGRRYCSRSCAQATRRTSIERACERCGAPFVVKPSKLTRGFGRFCSRACASAALGTVAPRTCPVCGVVFTPPAAYVQRGGGTFCGRACWRESLRLSPDAADPDVQRRLAERAKAARHRARRRGEHVPLAAQRPTLPDGMTVARLRAMRRDEYVAWGLEHGYFDIDVTTGRVTTHTGRRLAVVLNGQMGYPSVGLGYGGSYSRTVPIHRIIAVKTWGVAACRGMHVVHIDHDHRHSVLGNLRLMTPSAHYAYDFTDRGLHYGGARPKASWPPCALCGDPDGPINGTARTPARLSGQRFGIVGQLCLRCYQRQESAAKRHLMRRSRAVALGEARAFHERHAGEPGAGHESHESGA